ncbi:hypothetical protein SynPROSU1_02710 [Synechococcus sp. PROS-U-1]|nr:hypothetical protein SynPROSU1_02710 [Synechococcus sp. PROS-U-1]
MDCDGVEAIKSPLNHSFHRNQISYRCLHNPEIEIKSRG